MFNLSSEGLQYFQSSKEIEGSRVMTRRVRPIERFAEAVAKCSAEVRLANSSKKWYLFGIQSSAYGKCIVADYNAVHKDKCLAEFLRLKNCYIVRKILSSSSHQEHSLIIFKAAAKRK